MYDALAVRYVFNCPEGGEARVPVSALRTIERLPGAVSPAVFQVSFLCKCGDVHNGLISHDDLDWAPISGGAAGMQFLNLMTSGSGDLADELLMIAASKIKAGQWPWVFYCYPEAQQRPAFPSAIHFVSCDSHRQYGVAVRCPACQATSINIVSQQHLDMPFVNDPRIGVVEHVFGADMEIAVESFRATLYSASFDERRLDL